MMRWTPWPSESHSRKVNYHSRRGYSERSFDTVRPDHGSLRFLEHRISDRRIIRLIQKWLRAGILEDGVVTV